MLMKYVIGFMVKDACVLLIRKNKPEWQKGKLNGVGGKIEEGEKPIDAMVREFREETGMEHPWGLWRNTIVQTGKGYELNVFATLGDIYQAMKTEEEALEIVSVRDIPHHNVIPNLCWMIPLSFDEEVNHPVQVNAEKEVHHYDSERR